MSLPDAFWDSSALIPLCAAQPQTPKAKAVFKQYRIATWWATEVEIRSGLTRLRRMGVIDNRQFVTAKGMADRMIRSWIPVLTTRPVITDACSLLENHPLSAADALQIAAALEICEHKPNGYVFITGDQRQAEAARQIGFTIEYL